MQSGKSARQSLRICHDLNTPSYRCLRTRGAPAVRTRAQASRPGEKEQDVETPRRRSPLSERSTDISTPPERRMLSGESAASRADDFLRSLNLPSRRVVVPRPSKAQPPPPASTPRSSPATSTPTRSAPSTPAPEPVPHNLSYPPSQTTYTSYTHSPAPNPAQLTYSTRFFTHSSPTFLHSSASFRTLPRSSVPEVAFLGRSNVGKSSLLNALVERSGVKIANVSGKPGRTRTMNAFGVGGVKKVGGRQVYEGVTAGQKGKGKLKEGGRSGRQRERERDDLEEEDGVDEAQEEVEHEYRAGRLGRRERPEEERERDFERWVGRGGLVVLDMPGYGKASREEWGKEILKYLVGRKQLRRIFVLIDSTHGLKQTDLDILRLLSSNSLPHQVILTKLDRLLLPSSKTSNDTFLNNLANKFPVLCDSIRAQLMEKVYKDSKGKEIRAGTRASGDIIGVSEMGVPKGERGRKMGVECLRWEVLCAAGLECDAEGRPRVVEVHEADEETID